MTARTIFSSEITTFAEREPLHVKPSDEVRFLLEAYACKSGTRPEVAAAEILREYLGAAA